MRPEVSFEDLRAAPGNTGNVEENKSLYWNPAIYKADLYAMFDDTRTLLLPTSNNITNTVEHWHCGTSLTCLIQGEAPVQRRPHLPDRGRLVRLGLLHLPHGPGHRLPARPQDEDDVRREAGEGHRHLRRGLPLRGDQIRLVRLKPCKLIFFSATMQAVARATDPLTRRSMASFL